MAGVIDPAALNAYARAAKIGGGEGMSAGDTTSFGDVLGGVPDVHLHAERLQPLGHRRALLVRARHDVVEVRQQLRDAAHAAAAHPDEMNPTRPP